MSSERTIRIEPASQQDEQLLTNLLELYMHDMSEYFTLKLGDDGRFGYSKLPLYWSLPDRHFAFLIRADNEVVGFALVARGSPASANRDVLDVSEFFVLRSHRHARIGQQAAMQLWDRIPGTWTVRVAARNTAALKFWRETITAYTQGTVEEREHHGVSQPFQVFEFSSARA
jgi:predicted acetyltransferase